jgi:hypothetical protein
VSLRPITHPLLLILVAALAVRVLPATVNFVIGTDEALYLTLGQNLAAGRGFTEDGVTPHTEFAPGYPLFAALVYGLGGGLELPAQINLLVFGALLALPIYGLARELAGDRVARRAAWLTAVLPALALSVPNFEAPTEQLYSLFLWSGWFFLWRALKSAGRWQESALAGLCLGLAHLTRIEGLLFILLGIMLILFCGLRRPAHSEITPGSLSSFILHPSSPFGPRDPARRGETAFIVSAALFALPYALYVHAHTGLWLAPKGVLHQYHGEALRSDDPLVFEAAYAEYEYNRQHLDELPGILEYLWQNRDALPGFYFRNAVAELRQAFTSLSFMLVLWLPFALWGALKLWRTPTGPGRVAFLGLTCLPALIYPLSVVDPRYLLPLLPGAVILTAVGLEPEARAASPTSRFNLPSRSPVISFGIWTLGFGILFLSADLLGPFLIPRPVEYKALGEWMRANGVAAGETVLARKRQAPFYAGARWEWLPLTDTTGLLPYAAERGAQYVVIDERTAPTLRPELAYLLDPQAAPEHLELVIIMGDEGRRVVLYRLREDVD